MRYTRRVWRQVLPVSPFPGRHYPAARSCRSSYPPSTKKPRLPGPCASCGSHLDRLGLAWEIVVVDDGSADRTGAIVEAGCGQRPAYPADPRGARRERERRFGAACSRLEAPGGSWRTRTWPCRPTTSIGFCAPSRRRPRRTSSSARARPRRAAHRRALAAAPDRPGLQRVRASVRAARDRGHAVRLQAVQRRGRRSAVSAADDLWLCVRRRAAGDGAAGRLRHSGNGHRLARPRRQPRGGRAGRRGLRRCPAGPVECVDGALRP